ncbi:G patch domain-containing protein 2 [Entomophthora muscae]|uniref:G patch domain-containing protein 2 n=1 Tax=Entomophthora muscae TaxID=34485 RepID=A0ACC2SP04_9FUNG|nr:G patch domain-containing protein 2 [Entomophthora muscae]
MLDFEVKYMKTQKKPLYQSHVLISSLNDLDRLIRAFLLDGNQQQLSLCAMDSSIRSIVKDLLELYNLNYSVLDKRELKHLALYKTKRSGIPLWDKKQIQHDQHHPSGIFFNSPPLSKVIHELHLKWVKSCHQDAKYLKFSDLRFIDSCKKDVEEPTESKGLKVVGEDAPELTESNVGFRMLQKMGWAPDIKDTSGETNPAPIQVVVRKGKTGLGFSS